jgi:hypothetical protein
MATKTEGPAMPPLPLGAGPPKDTAARGARYLREPSEPFCEMCGSPVVAHHCKRICLKCGFMTGCSEGI